MGQFLRIVIVLGGLWIVLRLLRRALANRKTGAAPPSSADMLRCKYCGVFVPRQDVIEANGQHYCSEAHAEADRKRA